MTPERRRALLIATLAGLAALVAWDRLGARPDELVEPTRVPGPPRAGSASVSAPRGHSPAIARLASRDDYLAALEADAAATLPPAPPPPPPASAPPAPPPPPPFRVIGKGRVDGRWEVYLAQADRVVVVHAGDRIDGLYEVVSIAPPTLQLASLPTRETRAFAIGGAFDDQ